MVTSRTRPTPVQSNGNAAKPPVASSWENEGFVTVKRSRAVFAAGQQGAGLRIYTNGRTYSANLNAAGKTLLGSADYVRILVNPNNRRIVIVPTTEEDLERRTVRSSGNSRATSFSVTGLMKMLGFEKGKHRSFVLPIEKVDGALVTEAVPQPADVALELSDEDDEAAEADSDIAFEDEDVDAEEDADDFDEDADADEDSDEG